MTFLPTTVTQVVFYAAFAIWLAFTFLIEPMIIRSPSTKTAKTREDKGSGLLIYLSVFVAIITAFQFAGANIMPLPEWVFIVGICLMMLGIFVREWAVTTLRGFFLFTVGVRQDHKVIENGPYRLRSSSCLQRKPPHDDRLRTCHAIGCRRADYGRGLRNRLRLQDTCGGTCFGERAWRRILAVHEQDEARFGERAWRRILTVYGQDEAAYSFHLLSRNTRFTLFSTEGKYDVPGKSWKSTYSLRGVQVPAGPFHFFSMEKRGFA